MNGRDIAARLPELNPGRGRQWRGLADGGTPSLDGATKYKIRNSAGFTYDDGKTYPAGYDSFSTVLPDAMMCSRSIAERA